MILRLVHSRVPTAAAAANREKPKILSVMS